MSTHTARVALLGFGTVGRAVAQILTERPPAGVRLTHIYNRNVARKRADWVAPDVVWTEDVDAVFASDADVIVELIGGREPGGGVGAPGARIRAVRGDGQQAAHRARGPRPAAPGQRPAAASAV